MEGELTLTVTFVLYWFVRPLKILRITMQSATRSLSATRCWKNMREGSTWRVWTRRRGRRRRSVLRSSKKSTGNILKLTLRWEGWRVGDRMDRWTEMNWICFCLLHIKTSSSIQGSVDQLREVWEETDGLDPQEFNPKTFFKLHGESFCLQLDHKQTFYMQNELNCVFSLRYKWRRCVGWARAGGPLHKRGNVSRLSLVNHDNLLLTVMEADVIGQKLRL